MTLPSPAEPVTWVISVLATETILKQSGVLPEKIPGTLIAINEAALEHWGRAGWGPGEVKTESVP